MSVNINWDIENYKEENEIEDHWQLRRKFMERWKSEYPESKLVTLSKVFSNIEFMGCKYPPELMQEVARMSKEVAKDYREVKKTKLQRTFVSASDAAGDRARGTKREGGVIVNEAPKKQYKIAFVKPGEGPSDDKEDFQGNKAVLKEPAITSATNLHPVDESNSSTLALDGKIEKSYKEQPEPESSCSSNVAINNVASNNVASNNVASNNVASKNVPSNVYEIVTEPEKTDYLNELSHVRCVSTNSIPNYMFDTKYGRLVLLVRSWETKLLNIQYSCHVCGLKFEYHYDEVTNFCSVIIEGMIVAQACGTSKKQAKKTVENRAWTVLMNEAITVLVKEQFISQDDSRISFSEVVGNENPGPKEDEFGAPVEASVAVKMMKMMGWKGGGLGADSQGIAEPVKPHLQMVNRAGLGSINSDIRQIKRAADALMKRYLASDCLDLDLIFSSDFNKEERAALHIVAKNAGLISRSHGRGDDRFLVISKKIDPFKLAQAVAQKGGCTPKYQIFIPVKVASFYR